MTKQKLLIIDDDKDYVQDLLLFLEKDYSCRVAHSIAEGEIQSAKEDADLIILDIHFGGKKSGLDLLTSIQKKNPSLPVLMITRHDDVATIVSAMKNGARDYMTKPINFEELQIRLNKIFDERSLRQENLHLREQLQHKDIPFFGKSPAIKLLKDAIFKIAPLDTLVLFTGETGVGKEIAARALHRASLRSHRPFFVINCNAIPEHLIESELFGYEKGAFTGAVQSKPGKLEMASGSTLLIDEVGDLNISLQTKLLNVLESQEFYRLGGRELIKTDVRFVFATNSNLSAAVKDKRFREDLFYRINVFPLHVPPLRERPEDMEELIQFYLNSFARLTGKGDLRINEETIAYLKSLPWPGNIRQLKNAIERVCILADSDVISIGNFSFIEEMVLSNDDWIDYSLDYTQAKKKALGLFQKMYINQALKRANGNISKAAELMNLPRPSLQRMIKELE